MSIPPVFVLSSGRCGSTMVSNILNRHPRVLSLSEFFSFVGTGSFRLPLRSGKWMWDQFSRRQKRTELMLRESFEELLYPIDDPESRFSRSDVPPILCTTLPHLTERYEELFDELGPVVRGQPWQPPARHFRHFFAWLMERLDRDVWVERSGGSLLFAARLLRRFPEARVIHVYRDGRDTAISMSRHYLFRMIVANLKALRVGGFDAMEKMAKGKRWELISLWLEPVVSTFFKPERIAYDQVTLEDLGRFWSGLMERADLLLQDMPPDRLLNVKFEHVQADPKGQIRRLVRFVSPELEDEGWLREVSAIPRATRSKFAQLGTREQAALTAACRPGLERLGYAL